MTGSTPDDPNDLTRDERQLALVDRIIGLQGEVANLKSVYGARDMQDQLDAIHASATWRVGRAVLGPVFLARRLLGRKSTK
jgi:hypothetical protein